MALQVRLVISEAEMNLGTVLALVRTQAVVQWDLRQGAGLC